MSLYLKNKLKNNKEIVAALITSIASLAVAIILGYANLKSTEKQITNQLNLQKIQIDNQNDLLKKQIVKEQNESEERNKREIDHIDLMQKNSIELLNKQISKEITLFNEKKLRENQEEIQKAANFISSDILLKILALKGMTSEIDMTDVFNADAYLLPNAISGIDKMKYELFPSQEISPSQTYLEKLPIYQTHLRQLIINNSIISKQYGTLKKCWHYPAWIT